MGYYDELFARRLRELREEQGISQDDLAQRMVARGYDFRQQTVYKIETGNRGVAFGEAVELASSLGHTVEGILGEGEGHLVRLGAEVGSSQEGLIRAIREYAVALLAYTAAADGLGTPPRASVDRFLRRAVPNQTPALLASDAALMVRAEIERSRIRADGEYVSILVSALERDDRLFSELEQDRGATADSAE